MFKTIGEPLGLTKMQILDYLISLGQGAEFTVPQVLSALDIGKNNAYQQLRTLYESGFLTIKNAPPLPQDFYEWSAHRRTGHKRRTHYPRGLIYIVDFRGVAETIDERVRDLEDAKRRLLDELTPFPGAVGAEPRPRMPVVGH